MIKMNSEMERFGKLNITINMTTEKSAAEIPMEDSTGDLFDQDEFAGEAECGKKQKHVHLYGRKLKVLFAGRERSTVFPHFRALGQYMTGKVLNNCWDVSISHIKKLNRIKIESHPEIVALWRIVKGTDKFEMIYGDNMGEIE